MKGGEELKPGYKKTTLTSVKGKRGCKVTSLIKTEAIPEDIYTVSTPALNSSQCIIPDTFALSFKFSNSNTKSWFPNNLERLLCDRLSVNVQGRIVYKNTGESIMQVYKDLWRSDKDRDNRQEFGLANENVRKLISKDDSGNKATKTDGVLDLTIANMCDRMKIPLGKILCDHGPYAPYGMCDFEYRITVPKPNKIMKAQDGEDTGNYKLTDLHLKYEIIESEDLVRQVKDQYSIGRSLGYDYTTLLNSPTWKKDSTRETIGINIPRKSMKAIVLLFTKNDAGDSEDFPYPGLTRVNVTVEGNPNDLYSEGLAKRDMYDEARRFFGSSYVSRRKFYTDKFACVIDFRTVNDENVNGSGSYLTGTQSGILLEIEKEKTAKDLSCHIFVIADGIANFVDNKLQSVDY